MKTLLVTGGAGFIGSCFVLAQCAAGHQVVNLDKLTYSGNLENLSAVGAAPNYHFVHGDIGTMELVRYLLDTWQPEAIVNFAAESHVDRSINNPDAFVTANVVGTANLLRATLDWWKGRGEDGAAFRFLHVSTDEVYGSLGLEDAPFTERTPYAPNSPYSASKAASDHFVRAYQETYGLPTLITNCSNNYGPRQFPEKLIPVVILNALEGKPLPIYGQGANIRDWLHVEDHCEAIALVLKNAAPGSVYNIGGRAELTNLEVVRRLCALLDDMRPRANGQSYATQITFVADRPGHDLRYAIDAGKIERDLGWSPRHNVETGFRDTVRWYLDNTAWVERIRTGEYVQWMETNYGRRG